MLSRQTARPILASEEITGNEITWAVEKQTEIERIYRTDFHTNMARVRHPQAESFTSSRGSAL